MNLTMANHLHTLSLQEYTSVKRNELFETKKGHL